MLIANPLYDSVFKYLMEDLNIARRFLSLLLEEEILSLEFRPQERTARSEKHLITVFRMDFIAVIRTNEGSKKVLIELQKGKLPIDVSRFRKYWGENYSTSDMIDGERKSLPIISVYILGFRLSVEKPVLRILHSYQDMRTKEVLAHKDAFIEQLVHDSYIIQVPLLPEKAQTKLERLLTVFRQEYIYKPDDKWILKFPVENWDEIQDETLREVLKRLHFATQDDEIQSQIELEEELDLSMDNLIRQKDEAIQKVEEERKQKEEERKQKEEALQKAEEAESRLLRLARIQLGMGMSLSEVAKLLEMREDELKTKLDKENFKE